MLTSQWASIAVGAIITYGAYMPRKISILNAAFTIALADTSAALLIGLVVFPLVITYGLAAGEGPGLVFVSLPIAFGAILVTFIANLLRF